MTAAYLPPLKACQKPVFTDLMRGSDSCSVTILRQSNAAKKVFSVCFTSPKNTSFILIIYGPL